MIDHHKCISSFSTLLTPLGLRRLKKDKKNSPILPQCNINVACHQGAKRLQLLAIKSFFVVYHIQTKLFVSPIFPAFFCFSVIVFDLTQNIYCILLFFDTPDTPRFETRLKQLLPQCISQHLVIHLRTFFTPWENF